ncbi:hypothetical protein CLF_110241 [Clonorchis sinensis]|uniref:Endonuclease/exonuclease/phosphatase domain-containing protein n=1 Tax=Clonorchis sinensis TaxID=79923 RepID=G7YKG1_CLOSI|nr:hypothetical protein CLF_110241 [Clonorchis sinensis]
MICSPNSSTELKGFVTIQQDDTTAHQCINLRNGDIFMYGDKTPEALEIRPREMKIAINTAENLTLAITSANLSGYTTLGSSPSEAAETVLNCLSTNCLSPFNERCDIKEAVCLEQPSIIALTVTWFTPGVSDAEISVDGYSVFRADSKRGRAGGVALYVHAALPIPIVPSDNTPAPFRDALWIRDSLRGYDCLLLGAVYRCLSSPPEDDRFLMRTLEQLSSSYHFTHLLMAGDFNAPKAPWMELQNVRSSGLFAAALTEVFQQSAWTQHVVAPTRYRAGPQPSLPDLVITNERRFVDQVIIFASLGHNDHCVLIFDLLLLFHLLLGQKSLTSSVDSKILPCRLFGNADLS